MTSRAGNTLRSITYRLSSAAPTNLPHLVQPIATALLDCKSLLVSAPASKNPKEATDAVALHKFKTQLSTLVNGKTPEARFVATVLIKTTVELGGWEVLQGSGGGWVRGLLVNLGKSDPPSSKQLILITLTRIFLLTQEYPSLIREITTPSLPAFVTSCLNLTISKHASTSLLQLRAQSQLLLPVLQSFQFLLPHHPTIFRSYLTQLRGLILPLVAPTPSSEPTISAKSSPPTTDSQTTQAARQLLTLLPFCAPKSGSSEDWTSSVLALLSDTHATANKTFRSIIEDWQSVAGAQLNPIPATTTSTASDIVAQRDAESVLSLPPWSGIDAGCERLTGLLELLHTFVTSPTTSPVPLPIGRIVDLLRRILSVTVPPTRNTSNSSTQGPETPSSGLRPNTQIPAEERTALFASLPSIHVAATRVIEALLTRLNTVALPVLMTLVEHVAWVFRYESHNEALRGQCYGTCSKVLEITGSGFRREHVATIDAVIRGACGDVLPAARENRDGTGQDHGVGLSNGNGVNGAQGGKVKKGANGQASAASSASINADTFLRPSTGRSTHSISSPPTPLTIAAQHLLTTALLKLPSQHIPHSLRALLDRTAVLSAHSPAMLASVLNPPRSAADAKVHSSILPLLARAYPESLDVEALVRPRMPVLLVRYDEDEEEEEEGENGEDVHESTAEWNGEIVRGLGKGEGMDVDGEIGQSNGDNDLRGLQLDTNGGMRPEPLKKNPISQPAFQTPPIANNNSASQTAAASASAPASSPGLLKRTAPEADTSSSPKRAKLEPDTMSVLDSHRTDELDTAFVPVPMVVEKQPGSNPVSEAVTVAATAREASKLTVGADESDEGDFEMPVLTMEQDTEDEDEDEDDDDDDVEEAAEGEGENDEEHEEKEERNDDEDELGQP